MRSAWRFGARRHSIPCPVWLRWLVELENPLSRTARSAAIVEQLELQPGMTVLDAGRGPGRVTLPLARALGGEGQVVVLDIQAGMLERAEARARAARLENIRFVRAGLGEGTLEEGCFERAVLATVLGEIPQREAALAELFRALKPRGRLAVTEIIFDPHFQSRRAVTRLATAAGFREAACFGKRLGYALNFEKPAAG